MPCPRLFVVAFMIVLAALAAPTTALTSLAVVRPFAPPDAGKLVKAFDVWNEFPPCIETPAVPVDLFLCFSQEFATHPHVTDVIISIKADFYRQSQAWHQCFRSVQSFSALLTPDADRYDKKSIHDGWVNGPNLQFLAMARAFERDQFGKFDAWFLMELDNIPRRPQWLGALTAEVAARQPFTVVGSWYRGDSWKRRGLPSIPESWVFHVNGNALYNHTSPWLRAMVNGLEELARQGDKNPPFDVVLANYILERNLLPQEVGYWGNSLVIGNYADTVMTEAYCQNEYLVHGGYWYDDWDAAARPLTLVVADWGLRDEAGEPQLATFTRALLLGRHPFRRVIVLRPAGAITAPHYARATLMGDPIAFQEVPRTWENGWDLCAAPVATDHFAYSNVHLDHNLRAAILTVRHNGPIAAWYIPGGSAPCGSECAAHLQRATLWAGRPITRHYDETHLIFDTTIRNAFCSAWKTSPLRGTVGLSPHADEYMAFAEGFDGGKTYAHISSLEQFSRPQVLPKKTVAAETHTRLYVCLGGILCAVLTTLFFTQWKTFTRTAEHSAKEV